MWNGSDILSTRTRNLSLYLPLLCSLMLFSGCGKMGDEQQAVELSDAQLEDIVRRSYQYVAMFNVNNKFAHDEEFMMYTGGYNRVFANTTLADHRVFLRQLTPLDTSLEEYFLEVTGDDEPAA